MLLLLSIDTHIFLSPHSEELCVRQRSIDKRTERVKWAKNVLIEWHEALKDSEKGMRLIAKYFKDDQQRAREKDQVRILLTTKIDKLRKELIVLYDEQKALEQNLDCSANMYREAHDERRKMVETWKQAVMQMLQRERDIEKGEELQEELAEEAK